MGDRTSDRAERAPEAAHPEPVVRRRDAATGSPATRSLARLQRTRGNRYVQRLIRAMEESRSGDADEVPADVEELVSTTRGQGSPLPFETRTRMEKALGGEDFGDVRIHTDAPAARAAARIGAAAFTVGTDVYFGVARYSPGTPEGDRLLAHELTHVAQQRRGSTVLKAKMAMSSPTDPEEQQAESVAARVGAGRGGMAARSPEQGHSSLLRADGDPRRPPPPPAPEPGTTKGEPGDLVIELGDGIRIPEGEIAGRRTRSVELSKRPIRVPGLQLEKLVYNPRSKSGDLFAKLAIPLARPPRGGVRLSVDAAGKASFRGDVKLPFGIGVLDDPELRLEVVDKQVGGSLKIQAGDLRPRGMRKLKISGGGELRLQRGQLGGSVEAKLAYDGLAKGDFRLGFEDGVPSGKGAIEVTQPALKGVAAGLAIEKGDLKADLTVPATKIAPPVPGLSVPEGTVHIVMLNSVLSGDIAGLKIVYRDFGEGTLDGSFSKDQVTGSGAFTVKVPALDPVTGAIGFKNGSFYGHAVVSSDKFPKGLPVKRGSIKAGIDQDANLSFAGAVGIEFASVGRGTLKGAYEKGKLSLGADATLKVPGLSEVTAQVYYVNGDFEGAVDVPIESSRLAGLKGALHVEYKQKRWKAEQKITYERDNGKLKGTILLGLAQQEKGDDLAIYGGGDVTAQLTSFLSGRLRVDVLPEGTTTLKGTIRVTEPLQLFPEKKTDRELFNVSRNIPLWAILVAVIRLRGGVRAGVGPGVFRDIAVTGEYTIGGEDESTPSFSISGEIFIPAFAEAYLAFGVGLGLDVVLGSLTGGIEAVGTAGIYGAVSVVPELSYRDGDYTISGTATMAAGAKLKLGLQAWAEVEALWITVWEQTWQLAEWVWNVGPTLAMQAKVEHVLGSGEAPSFEFKTSDIGNAEQLVNDAMPKDGPKGSGAREALKNRAKWSGRTKGKGKSADQVPEPKSKAAAPKAPPKPAKRPKSAAGAKGPLREKGGKTTPELEKLVAKKAKDDVGPAKMTSDRLPKFPAPTAREVEVGRANYLDETPRGRIPLAAFRSKMQAGHVYHPKYKSWSTLGDDYIKAYPTLREPDKDPRTFASKMRGGYYPGSVVTDPLYDATEKSHEGNEDDPYPIHWPTQFLVPNFESFVVTDGTRIVPTPPDQYEIDTGSRTRTYTFGVAPTWVSAMSVGRKVKRQEPGRSAGSTASEWDHWRNVGFTGSGGAAAAAGPRPRTTGTPDESMFRVRHLPNATKDPIDTTFGQYIDSGANPLFSGYLSLPRQVDRDAFRAAARAGEFNVMNPIHVNAWVAYLGRKAEAERSERGVLGYEMQHAMPLFLWGREADEPRNMWPLSVSQHRTGHSILRSQPRLKEHWNAPTDNLESRELLGCWFVISKHGGP